MQDSYSVTQVAAYIKSVLTGDILLRNINIEGEVADCKISGGHAYFKIKDEGAAIECIKFSALADRDFKLKIGDKVIVTASCNLYEKTGKLSMIVSKVKPFGYGEIWQRYLISKEKLDKEGYFDVTNKKPIPQFPKRIGVVTSPEGAVIRDIIRVIKRRNPTVDIVVYPVKVQGAGAEDEIAAGIDFFSVSNVDTVIVARGGGSVEDLSPFYSEKVAIKVFECKKPIISAIGHETDVVLCDFTADMRAATPSVAAEIATTKLVDMAYTLKYTLGKICDVVGDKITACNTQFKNYLGNMSLALQNKCAEEQNCVHMLMSKLELLSPLMLLKKGYARVIKDDKLVLMADEIAAGDNVDILMSDGVLNCEVKSKGKGKKYGI